jgi:hypothetical protein
VNFVGHIHLAKLHLAGARSGQPDDSHTGFLIGAALPDFAAMGRFRLTGRAPDESIRAGVELHHRTDDAFHTHRWFQTSSQAVSARLQREGLPRGAAKACGHVGVELLLDGWLLDENRGLRRAVEQATAGVEEPALGLVQLVDDAHRSAWTTHLRSISSWPLPSDYRRPEAVAERLRRILSRRPRLAFTAGHVELVSQVLGEHQRELESGSATLIQDLENMLAV